MEQPEGSKQMSEPKLLTREEIIRRLRATVKPKPNPNPAIAVVSEHKLSVDGQRERVAHDMKQLVEAEKGREPVVETFAQKQERQRREGLYYRRLYEATAQAEYWAKQIDNPARRGDYSPIARFEDEVR
jgi:hypothetical protein